MSSYDHAIALLVREVLCEQVYRNRGAIVNEDGTFTHPNHICRTLKMRALDVHHVADHATPRLLTMTSDELKAEAARVLDIVGSD